MISKVLVVVGLVCGICALFAVKAFGLDSAQFAGAGVIALAVAALL
jgi:hypothetical protein